MEKRISNINILKINNPDLNKAIKKVYEKTIDKINEIEIFINSIPEKYNELLIMSNLRKEYYIKTLKIRLYEILKPKYNELLEK